MVSSSLALLFFVGLDLPSGSRAVALIGDEVLQNGEIFPGRPQASGFGPGWQGLRPGWMAQKGEPMGGRTYRTSSPIGAAALLLKGRSRPIKRGRARELLTI